MGARRSTARQSTNYRIIDKRHFSFDSYASDTGEKYYPSSAFAAAKQFCKNMPPANKYEFYQIRHIDGKYIIFTKDQDGELVQVN